MGGTWNLISCGAVALLLSSCTMLQNDSLDLRRNHELYRDTGYRTRLACDQIVFFKPLIDDRLSAEAVPATTGPFPVTYMPDNLWNRPLLEMIEDIVIDELEETGVFAGLDQSVPPLDDALILEMTLKTLRGGLEERTSGRRTFAEVGIEVRIFGPLRAGAERQILFEDEFGKVSSSNVVVHPPMIPKMIGSSIHGVLYDMLARVDQSNVARSGVPTAPLQKPVPAGTTEPKK